MVNLPVHRLLNRAIPVAVKRTFQEILKTQVIAQGVTLWDLNTDACQRYFGDGLAIPGSPFNLVGNDGKTYPVQALWSNISLNGVGYCSQGN